MYQVDINDVIRNYELKNQEGFLFCLFDAISNALYSSIDNNVCIRGIVLKNSFLGRTYNPKTKKIMKKDTIKNND